MAERVEDQRPPGYHLMFDVVAVDDEGNEIDMSGEGGLVERGGPGSGHFGHKGREGKVGGSLPGRKGVTRPITPAAGKRVVSVPEGGVKTGQEPAFGARKWIVISEEELDKIRLRSKKEISTIAFDSAMVDLIGGDEPVDHHVKHLELFHSAFLKYIEQERPGGGWTHAYRRTASALKRAIEAYKQDGDKEHMERFWQSEAGVMKALFDGPMDERYNVIPQRGQESTMWNIMREMPVEEGMEHIASPLNSFYHVAAFAGGYEWERKQMLMEQQGIQQSERWGHALIQQQDLMESRGAEIKQTAEKVAFELSPYDARGIELKHDRTVAYVEATKTTQEIEHLTSEIDANIQAGGTPEEILAKNKPLQEHRSDLYDERQSYYDEADMIVDMEVQRRSQQRGELIQQLRLINPSVGTGEMQSIDPTFMGANWIEMGMDTMGRDAAYWENLKETDPNLYQERIDEAVRIAETKFEDDMVPAINDGLQFLDEVLPDEMTPITSVEFRYDTDDDYRAHYMSGTDTVSLEKGDGVDTVIHEVGHFIEDNIVAVEDAAVAFLITQGEGHEIRSLNDIGDNEGYESYERAFDGAFNSDYAGKVYYNPVTDDYQATELVSMGLERLYSDAARFARDDPEHFEFMIALLSGEYWE